MSDNTINSDAVVQNVSGEEGVVMAPETPRIILDLEEEQARSSAESDHWDRATF